jgi:hypothetical protein
MVLLLVQTLDMLHLPEAYLHVDCITGVNSLNPKPLILIRTWVLISNIELLFFFLIDVHISVFDAKPS